MSNDLIKRMDTIENIWSLFNNTYNDASRFDAEETELAKRILSDVQIVLEKQPTAYDVDKVVERLKKIKSARAYVVGFHCDNCPYKKICDELTPKGYKDYYCNEVIKKIAYDIVKSGGIE